MIATATDIIARAVVSKTMEIPLAKIVKDPLLFIEAAQIFTLRFKDPKPLRKTAKSKKQTRKTREMARSVRRPRSWIFLPLICTPDKHSYMN
jgi:hypothetical protein